ncbi:MAG: alpha-glycosidase [Cellulosilyticaceae bacterium]
MNLHAIYHEPKSKYAYAYDKETLHIRIRTQKEDIDHIKLVAVDPFNWIRTKEDPTKYIFDYTTIQKVDMKKEYSNERYDFWFVEVKGFKWLRVKYAFILEKKETSILYGPYADEPYVEGCEKEGEVHNYFNFPFINEEDIYEGPSWAKDMVWYQIFPERFANGDKSLDPDNVLEWNSTQAVTNEMFFGGDLQGVMNHLHDLKELGITGIYFTPIFESPTCHKYDTTDYFKIDSCFGTNEKFKELVDEAHKLGMKVMLDAVFNHCGFKHPFWQDVMEKGKASPYYDYFHILHEPIVNFEVDEEGMPCPLDNEQQANLAYRTFAFVPAMPKWQTANAKARRYLLDVGKYWVEQYDIDGWRLDVSNEVSHDFWRDFRKEVKAVKKDVYIIGENWDNSYPWLMGDQFDAVMNYELLYPIWNFVGHNSYSHQTMTASQYKDTVSTLLANYPKHVTEHMFNMIDSHDTPRLMNVCDQNEDKVKLAYILQMTFAGAPSIYYGSEVGVSGEGEDNRRCMPWQESYQNRVIKAHVKRMIAIRKTIGATRTADIVWLTAEDATNYLAFAKESEEETLYVLMNNQDKAYEVTLPEAIGNQKVKDVYTNEERKLGTTETLSAYGFRLYVVKK